MIGTHFLSRIVIGAKAWIKQLEDGALHIAPT